MTTNRRKAEFTADKARAKREQLVVDLKAAGLVAKSCLPGRELASIGSISPDDRERLQALDTALAKSRTGIVVEAPTYSDDLPSFLRWLDDYFLVWRMLGGWSEASDTAHAWLEEMNDLGFPARPSRRSQQVLKRHLIDLRHWVREQIAGTAPGDERNPLPDVGHSKDFRSCRWYRQTYSFTANQAACVKVLWQHWEHGTPDVAARTVLDKTEISTERLDRVFRTNGKINPAWGTMIVTTRKGTHRLQEPQPTVAPSPAESPKKKPARRKKTRVRRG